MIDNDGLRVTGNCFSIGSGSPYAFGVLDTEYRYDMTDAQAYELARRAIYHATMRDPYSGGNVSGKSRNFVPFNDSRTFILQFIISRKLDGSRSKPRTSVISFIKIVACNIVLFLLSSLCKSLETSAFAA